jgi:CRISPR-associated protein Cas1
MAWRGLHLSDPASLSRRQAGLEIKRDGQDDVRIPLEDIAWIVIDSREVAITSSLLSSCAERGIAVIFTDDRHLPSGSLLPFHINYAQAEVSHLQFAAPGVLRRRLWRRVVRVKILNQAAVLAKAGASNFRVLRSLARQVQPGDPDNVEARAARRYWTSLFPAFRRDADASDRTNALLNYGYAVMRAGVARSLAVAGLIPAIGIHHHSQMNPFNLADDLIEPFRPTVDWLAFEMSRQEDWGDVNDPGLGLPKEDRQRLAGILTHQIRIENEEMNVLNAIDRSVASFVRSLRSRRSGDLNLPEFV